MASITVERVASTGEAFEAHEPRCPMDLPGGWCGECQHGLVEIEVDLEATDVSVDEPDVGVVGGAEDYRATACGWPVELTDAEEKSALELLNDELRGDADFASANRRARAAGERRYAAYRWS